MLSFLSGLNPQTLAVKALAVVLVLVGVYFYGYHTGYAVADSAAQTAVIAAKDQAEKNYKADLAKQNAHATDLEQQLADARSNVQVREKTVTKIVKQPVYKNQCFDKAGLDELNDLIKHKGGHQ